MDLRLGATTSAEFGLPTTFLIILEVRSHFPLPKGINTFEACTNQQLLFIIGSARVALCDPTEQLWHANDKRNLISPPNIFTPRAHATVLSSSDYAQCLGNGKFFIL